jgi:steroid 5-alpha reductase family enzyme
VWALCALCVAFLGLYACARHLDNYGIVDIAWSYAFALLALGYGFLAAGWPPRRFLVAAIVTVWAGRLGTHLLVRIAAKHPEEDGRYRQLRRDWGSGFRSKMAGFFVMQAASVVVLGIPFLAAASNRSPSFSRLEWTGAALWLISIGGEALADAQLASFRKASPGAVCDAGLWKYSRHPNYFFEWLVWVSYALFAFASPLGWIGIASPACILFLLLRVTGIPATEQQSIRSKGEAYLRYQGRTSAFVPLPPRKTP